MATSKIEVFNRFLNLINDVDICSLLTDQDMTEMLDYFIKRSASVEFKNCKKDLSDATEPVFYRESFIGDGSSVSYIISQYPATPNEDSISMFAQVDETDVLYGFTESTKTFVLSATPTLSSSIVLGYDDVGQFNETLSEEEMWILAHGMILSWQSSKLRHTSMIKNRLTSKDFKSFSPANLLEKMLELHKYSYKEMHRLIVNYSFNDFTGFS
ncbi:MAG: hypothetical protein D4S01_00465 [Dehalococcoidia bacterium]|nr:MAG: hypothetical protein D4S01_00465 [Dehalococcoidia bacterium]